MTPVQDTTATQPHGKKKKKKERKQQQKIREQLWRK